jgi:hypothetical protein
LSRLNFIAASRSSDSSSTVRYMSPSNIGQSNIVYEPPIVSISDAYDSGNGEFVSAEVVNEEECDVRVKVRIKEDP